MKTFSLFYVRPAALVEGQTEGVEDSTQIPGAGTSQAGGQTGATSDVKTEQAKIWGQEEFLSRTSRFLDGVLPVVAMVAGRAKRLNRTNAELDKSRRLIAELSPGTIVLMKNEDKANDEAPWSPPMVVFSCQGNSYIFACSVFTSLVAPV